MGRCIIIVKWSAIGGGILLCLILLWNFTVLFIYGFDKLCAVRGSWRISEKILLTIAFIMGGVGAFLGMGLFRHKTRKPRFRILVPSAAVLQVIVYWYIFK